jgi:hypothetical protein
VGEVKQFAKELAVLFGFVLVVRPFADISTVGWVVIGIALVVYRKIMNRIDPVTRFYERHVVNGAERWFCELCGKEEGDCPRCNEAVV